MGKLYSTLMCHIIHLFKLTAPGTYSSDEFLFEEFNISKEDRRWASENLHSLWLIDLQHGEKVSVTTSGTERQMQQVVKEAWGFLRQCNPSCSCRCYFSQRWPKWCSSGCKQTQVVICTPFETWRKGQLGLLSVCCVVLWGWKPSLQSSAPACGGHALSTAAALAALVKSAKHGAVLDEQRNVWKI